MNEKRAKLIRKKFPDVKRSVTRAGSKAIYKFKKYKETEIAGYKQTKMIGYKALYNSDKTEFGTIIRQDDCRKEFKRINNIFKNKPIGVNL